jgi:hypothetical protein
MTTIRSCSECVFKTEVDLSKKECIEAMPPHTQNLQFFLLQGKKITVMGSRKETIKTTQTPITKLERVISKEQQNTQKQNNNNNNNALYVTYRN